MIGVNKPLTYGLFYYLIDSHTIQVGVVWNSGTPSSNGIHDWFNDIPNFYIAMGDDFWTSLDGSDQGFFIFEWPSMVFS